MERVSVRGRRGFTLMELLIVLAIILLVSGFAWPNLRSMMEQHSLQSAGRELRAELGKTRLRAIETGTVFEVRYSPGTNQFQILAKPTALRSIESDSDSGLSSGLSDSSTRTGGGSTQTSAGNFGGSGTTSSIGRSGSSSNSSRSSTSSISSSSSSTSSSSSSSGTSVSSSSGSSGVASSGLVTKESDRAFGRGLTLNSSGELIAEVVKVGSNIWFDDPDYRATLTSESSDSNEVQSASVGDTSVSSIASSSKSSSKESDTKGDDENLDSLDRDTSSDREIPLSEQLRRPRDEWPEAISGTDSIDTGASGSDSSSDFTDWSRPILFFPNGRTSTTTIRLWTVNDRYIEVSLRGVTGQVTISKPTRYNEELETLRQDERTYLEELREESSGSTSTSQSFQSPLDSTTPSTTSGATGTTYSTGGTSSTGGMSSTGGTSGYGNAGSATGGSTGNATGGTRTTGGTSGSGTTSQITVSTTQRDAGVSRGSQ